MEPNSKEEPKAEETSWEQPANLPTMLEDTLTAPFALGKVFAKHAQAPSPGVGVLAANVAFYSAAFLILLVLRFRLSFPAIAGNFEPARYASAVFCCSVLLTAASFAAAGILHALCAAAGGKQDFQRSYHILSLLALFLPSCAAASMFRFGWPALAVFWTFLTAVAVENMAGAPAGRARAVLGGAAACAIGAAWFAAAQVERYVAPLRQAAAFQAQLQREAQDAMKAPPLSAVAAGVAASSATMVTAPQAQQLAQALQQASSLNLISGPSGQISAPTPAQVQAIAAQIQQHPGAAPQFAAQTLQSVMPLLDNPNLTKGMPPEQAKQIQAMSALLKQMGGNMQAGKPLTAEQKMQLMKTQQAAMQMMMQQMQQTKKGAPQPQPQPQQGTQP
jgi:hypothetical protein